MTDGVVESVEINCPTCRRWMGEVPPGWKCVGTFEDPRDRAVIPHPRLTLRCKGCGWVMIFAEVARRAWRQGIELKQRTA